MGDEVCACSRARLCCDCFQHLPSLNVAFVLCRLFTAEWLVRGGGADQAASSATLSTNHAQQEQLTEQAELIEELVAEHAACEAERREAVQNWAEKVLSLNSLSIAVCRMKELAFFQLDL